MRILISSTFLFFLIIRRSTRSTLFPYTTLFRSFWPGVWVPHCTLATDLAKDQFEIGDRKSTRLNSSHTVISYAVFCLKKKKKGNTVLRGVRDRNYLQSDQFSVGMDMSAGEQNVT